MYGWLTAGIATAILSVLLWNAERRLDNLRDEAAQLRVNEQTAIHANETIRQTLDVCKEVNEHNATQRDSAELRAEQAEVRVRVLAQMLEEEIDEIETDDQTCRTLAQPLPDDFLDQLCVNNANCSD